MRGQYSIEVIMIVAAFFMVISIFVGLYATFSEKEQNIGAKAKMNLEINRIRNAVNHVYVTGPGNRIELEISLGEYELGMGERLLVLRHGEMECERGVFAELSPGHVENENVLVIRNENGGVTVEGAE